MLNELPSPWLDLEASLAAWMRTFQTAERMFTAGYKAIPGFPSDGFRADGLLTDGRVLLALEVEAKQAHPDTNVGKYWILHDYKQYERIELVHVYTPAYNSYPWRKKLGEFYSKKMERELPFSYHQMDLRQESTVESAFNIVTALLAERIAHLFKEERQLHRSDGIAAP